MVALSTLQANRLPVTVKNTFVDVDDKCSPKYAMRSSSTPPSLSRNTSELSVTRVGSDSSFSFSDTDDGTMDPPGSRTPEELEDSSFPDTDDEWEVKSPCLPPRAGPSPAVPSMVSGANDIVVGACCSSVMVPEASQIMMMCPSVPSYLDSVIVASEPDAPRPHTHRCMKCRGRLGDRCACAPRQVDVASSATKAPALPRSHAHTISVKNVLVDAEAPMSLAETTLRVHCASGAEGIVVERVVRRSGRLSAKAREFGPLQAATAAAAGPAAAGRTRLSSTARAWQPGKFDAAPAPSALALAADGEPPREKSPEPLASGASGAPKFGSALLRCVADAMRKCIFVAGATVSTGAAGGWCLQIDMRREYLYLKEHVLACAQEALFDGLDELDTLRARGPPTGRGIPMTVFDLKVECLDMD